MRQQYGLRIQSEEFDGMSWDEFSDLLGGLNESTPLVRVAQIRTTTDRDVIKEMTPEQRRMRSEWQKQRAMKRGKREVENAISMMQKAFEHMYGEPHDHQ